MSSSLFLNIKLHVNICCIVYSRLRNIVFTKININIGTYLSTYLKIFYNLIMCILIGFRILNYFIIEIINLK